MAEVLSRRAQEYTEERTEEKQFRIRSPFLITFCYFQVVFVAIIPYNYTLNAYHALFLYKFILARIIVEPEKFTLIYQKGKISGYPRNSGLYIRAAMKKRRSSRSASHYSKWMRITYISPADRDNQQSLHQPG